MKQFLDHFGEPQHFKNVIYLIIVVTICYLVIVKADIPEHFWSTFSLITGYYFGSSRLKNGNGNDNPNKNV